MFPPPTLASARSAPSRFERYASAATASSPSARAGSQRSSGADPAQDAERLAHAVTSAAARSANRARASAQRPLLGLVHARRERGADDLARLREGAELAERDRLHEQVPDQRRLLGACEHGQPRGGRRPPAERLVAGAAADDVELRRRRAGDRREQADDLGVLEREALEDAARDRGDVAGLRLPRRGAEVDDALRHVARGGEGRVVGVDERAERLGALRRRDELVEGEVATGGGPAPAALVEEPEPGDVPSRRKAPTPPSFVRFARVGP
jgi:hypothetical protein